VGTLLHVVRADAVITHDNIWIYVVAADKENIMLSESLLEVIFMRLVCWEGTCTFWGTLSGNRLQYIEAH
jgi:hypothetical protein